MATQSPFPFLDNLFGQLAKGLQPPPWLIEEVQRRMVLLLNHVLMREPEAQRRLVRQKGRVVEARWRNFTMRLVATPAGLLDLAAATQAPDLTLILTEESPWQLAQAAARGGKPPVQIAGDVQFAAEVNWLVDHVRWDLEEDLSRLVGDAPAHAIGQGARRMVEALRRFAAPAASAQQPAAAGDAGSGAGPAAPPGSSAMPPGGPSGSNGA
jgi:ubiquinone biosynthesis protein UbiJ